MEAMSFEKRKSHLVHQGSDARVPVWQGVGSVTILGPEIDRPLFLDGVDYTVFFREAKREGDLREAVILLNRLNQSAFGSSVIWLFLAMLFGAAVMRTWIFLH